MSDKTVAQQQVDALLADARNLYPACSDCGEDLIPHDGELCGICANDLLALLAEARGWIDKHRCCTEERRNLVARIDAALPPDMRADTPRES